MTNSRKELSFSDHTHSGYALTNHTHSNYALTTHTHSGYASSNHTHSQYMTQSSAENYIDTIIGNLDINADISFFTMSSNSDGSSATYSIPDKSYRMGFAILIASYGGSSAGLTIPFIKNSNSWTLYGRISSTYFDLKLSSSGIFTITGYENNPRAASFFCVIFK